MTEKRRLLLRRALIVCGLVALTVVLAVRASFSDDPLAAGFEAVLGMSIVISVVIGFWGGGEDESLVPEEFRDLPIGIGTLRSVEHTRLEVNGVQQYDVTFDVVTAQGVRFTGTQRILLEREIVEELHPGLQLPVHHHADGRTEVAMALDTDGEDVDLARMSVQVAEGSLSEELADVARRGLRTKAEVLSFDPTGEIRGGEAVVVIGLRVTRPDGSTFDHTSERTVGADELPCVRPGSAVDVRYLPEREDLVVMAIVVPQRGKR